MPPPPQKAKAQRKATAAKPKKPRAAPKRRLQRGGDGECSTASDAPPVYGMFVSSMPARIPFGAPIASETLDVIGVDRSPVMYNPSGLLGVRADTRVFPVESGLKPPGFNLGVVNAAGGAQLSGGGARRPRKKAEKAAAAKKKPAAKRVARRK